VIDIKVDRTHAIIEFIAEEPVAASEADEVGGKLEAARGALPEGRAIRIKAEIRGLLPPDIATQVGRSLHGFVKSAGVQRIAELIDSEKVAAELGRAAKEAGTDKVMRRFWEEESAREWLINGDIDPSSIGARWK
jgi:hypothetical protein